MKKLDSREVERFLQVSRQVSTHLGLKFASPAYQANILPTLLCHPLMDASRTF